MAAGPLADLINTLVVVALIHALGFYCAWTKKIDPHVEESLLWFIHDIALPALLFKALAQMQLSLMNARILLGCCLAKLIVAAVCAAVSRYAYGRAKKGMATTMGAVAAIYCANSEDLALGLPCLYAMHARPSGNRLPMHRGAAAAATRIVLGRIAATRIVLRCIAAAAATRIVLGRIAAPRIVLRCIRGGGRDADRPRTNRGAARRYGYEKAFMVYAIKAATCLIINPILFIFLGLGLNSGGSAKEAALATLRGTLANPLVWSCILGLAYNVSWRVGRAMMHVSPEPPALPMIVYEFVRIMGLAFMPCALFVSGVSIVESYDFAFGADGSEKIDGASALRRVARPMVFVAGKVILFPLVARALLGAFRAAPVARDFAFLYGVARRPSGDLARWSWLCYVLQEDGTSSPTLQKSAAPVPVRPRLVGVAGAEPVRGFSHSAPRGRGQGHGAHRRDRVVALQARVRRPRGTRPRHPAASPRARAPVPRRRREPTRPRRIDLVVRRDGSRDLVSTGTGRSS